MTSQWYMLREGKEQGPMTIQQLRMLVAAGDLQPQDLVRREDQMFPVEARIVNGLFPADQPVHPLPHAGKAPSRTSLSPHEEEVSEVARIADNWFIERDGKVYGPYSTQRMRDMVADGRIEPTDLVRKNDMDDFVEAREYKIFFPAKRKAKATTEPPPLRRKGRRPRREDSSDDEIPVARAAPSVKWYNTKWFRITLAVLVVFFGILKLALRESSGGSITFAEYVDPTTMQTRNEGKQFTTGQVWMVVRGRSSFGDTKLIFYSRDHGTDVWVVLGEVIVDPSWDVAAWQFMLETPGNFDVKAMTGKGKLVAQSTVQVIAK